MLMFNSPNSFVDETKTLKEIKEVLDTLKTSLMTMSGISYALAAIKFSEIKDINTYFTPAKLLAFAG